MGRPLKSKLFPLACSKQTLAAELALPLSVIDRAVETGDLPLYQVGLCRRILVEDAVKWLRTFPRVRRIAQKRLAEEDTHV